MASGSSRDSLRIGKIKELVLTRHGSSTKASNNTHAAASLLNKGVGASSLSRPSLNAAAKLHVLALKAQNEQSFVAKTTANTQPTLHTTELARSQVRSQN